MANLIGSREACQLLGITRGTLTYWMLQGRVTPAQAIEGPSGRVSQHLWDRAEIERLAQRAAS